MTQDYEKEKNIYRKKNVFIIFFYQRKVTVEADSNGYYRIVRRLIKRKVNDANNDEIKKMYQKHGQITRYINAKSIVTESQNLSDSGHEYRKRQR